MSRHRNVRSINYSDEYDGYDDVYGHSVEDDYTISPSDAAFMYDRSSRQPRMSIYLKGEEDIAEEDEQSSKDYYVEQPNKIDNEKLAVCLDEVKNVLGDTYPEQMLINTIVDKQYDTAAVVDFLLNKVSFSKREATDSPKPQRLTSLRGGSVDEELSCNSGNHPNERILQDVIPSNKSISVKMDVDYCLLEKYKKFEIDFSQVLIQTYDNSTFDQNDCCKNNSKIDENMRSTNNKDTQEIGSTGATAKFNEKNKKSFKKCRHPLYTSYLSKVGYYLCMKCVELPKKMKLHIDPQSTITPFKFDTRSPDEVTKKNFVIIKKLDHKIKF